MELRPLEASPCFLRGEQQEGDGLRQIIPGCPKKLSVPSMLHTNPAFVHHHHNCLQTLFAASISSGKASLQCTPLLGHTQTNVCCLLAGPRIAWILLARCSGTVACRIVCSRFLSLCSHFCSGTARNHQEQSFRALGPGSYFCSPLPSV